MENSWDKLHKAVDFLLPYVLILLIVVLVVEFFFAGIYEKYNLAFVIADSFIVFVFVIDLILKYKRATSIPGFLKDSWLDIIAVFPFFLCFRVFETVGIIGAAGAIVEAGEGTQKVLHTGLEVEKEVGLFGNIGKEAKLATNIGKEAMVAEEAKLIAEGARSERLLRFARPVLRTPRLSKAVEFYEEPQHKKEIKKDIRGIEDNIKRIKRKIMH